jgi:gas vesicle protein
MWLWDRAHLQNYFNNLIDRRFWLWAPEESFEERKSLPDGIDLDAYEDELQKIEYKKAHKAEEIQTLKDTLNKLKDYKKRFKTEGRDDMVEKIDKDIATTQEKLDELEK